MCKIVTLQSYLLEMVIHIQYLHICIQVCVCVCVYGYIHTHSRQGSSDGMATDYGLDCPGIESRWGRGRDFLHLSIPALGLTQPPVQLVPGLFWG
jgi:hypothetical protein